MYKPEPNQKVPAAVMEARALVMRRLHALKTCTRCGGEGHLDRKPNWIVVEKTGRKTCFRCWGSGTEMDKAIGPDPLVVRYSVVGALLPLVHDGNVDAIAKKAKTQHGSRYWPVLADVYERALAAAKTALDDGAGDTDDYGYLDDYEDEYSHLEHETAGRIP